MTHLVGVLLLKQSQKKKWQKTEVTDRPCVSPDFAKRSVETHPSIKYVYINDLKSTHLFVPRPDLAVEVQRLLGLLELAPVQEVGADHYARAALARLAVDGGHMIVVFAQPLVQVLTEGLDQLQLGRVVVFEGVLCNWRGRRRGGRGGGCEEGGRVV